MSHASFTPTPSTRAGRGAPHPLTAAVDQRPTSRPARLCAGTVRLGVATGCRDLKPDRDPSSNGFGLMAGWSGWFPLNRVSLSLSPESVAWVKNGAAREISKVSGVPAMGRSARGLSDAAPPLWHVWGRCEPVDLSPRAERLALTSRKGGDESGQDPIHIAMSLVGPRAAVGQHRRAANSQTVRHGHAGVSDA